MAGEVGLGGEGGGGEGLEGGGSKREFWECVQWFDMGLAGRWWMEAYVCFQLLGHSGCAATQELLIEYWSAEGAVCYESQTLLRGHASHLQMLRGTKYSC